MAVLGALVHAYSAKVLSTDFDRLVAPSRIVTAGPYSVVRHPIYTSYLMLFTGYTCAFGCWQLCLATWAIVLVYYHRRI